MVSDYTKRKTVKVPKIRDFYTLKGTVGRRRSGNGEVREAILKSTEQKRAVKMLFRHEDFTKQDADRVAQQIEVLKCLDHPNILKFYEAYKDSKNYYIVTELCTGGELFDIIMQHGTCF